MEEIGLRFEGELSALLAVMGAGIALRAIPEVLSYPYMIGHDTILYAGVIQRVEFCQDVLSYFPPSPLLPLILCPLGKMFGPVAVMKIYPPVVYGMLAAALYMFARESLRMDRTAGIVSTLFILLQFGMLRISWDLHRNLLAIVFLLILLMLLMRLSQANRPASSRQILLTGGLATLVILTHEFTSLLMVGILVIIVIVALLKGEQSCLWNALPPTLVGATVLCYVAFLHPHLVSDLFATYVWQDVLEKLPVFFGLLFLPMIPFAVLGRRVNRVQLAWIFVTATASLSPILSPVAFAFWDRWMLMMILPIGYLATDGMLRVAGFGTRSLQRVAEVSTESLTSSIVPVFLLMLCFVPSVYLASGFMSYSSNQPFWYFDNPILWRGGSSGIPSTMLSNTLALQDVPDVMRVISQLNAVMGPNDVVLAHEAFYGWLLLYLDHGKNMIRFYDNRVQRAITSARAEGFGKIYLLWFIPNTGWHAPDPDLSIFSEVFRSGVIVAYAYLG